MGIKPAASILFIVDSKGTILYSNKDSISLYKSGRIENIGDLHFKPNLGNILKSYRSTSDESSSDSQSYKVVEKSAAKKYTALIKRITNDDNRLYSLELCSADEPVSRDFFTWIKRSANENSQFLIIADGTGSIKYISDYVKSILKITINSNQMNNLFDLVQSSFDTKDIKSYKTALVDGKHWQTDAAISGYPDRFIRLKLYPVRDDDNRVNSLMLFGDEISDLVREKVAYVKAGELAKAVIDNMPGLVAILKGRGEELILADANPAFVNVFKIPKRRAFNSEIEKIFTAEFVNVIRKKINTATVKDKSYFEYTLSRKEMVYFAGKIIKLKGLTESVNFYIITMRDITDILRYEKELKKNYDRESYVSQLKTSFLINMATEIRTPFNSIMSYSDLIDDYIKENDFESVKELLESTKDVLKRVVNLFTNVTEVAQIETGDIKVGRETLDCNELIRLAFNKIENEVKDENLDFEMRLYPGALLIKADWVKVERVVFLLLDNAMRSSSKGRIAAETTILNGYAHIRIYNSEYSFPAKDLNSETDTDQTDGEIISLPEADELGITIASHYTKLMGGEFYIENRSGKGSVVTLSFPLISE